MRALTREMMAWLRFSLTGPQFVTLAHNVFLLFVVCISQIVLRPIGLKSTCYQKVTNPTLLQRCHPASGHPRDLPSLPGSRLTSFYRDASSALVQLVIQHGWIFYLFTFLTLFPPRKKEHKFWFSQESNSRLPH